MDEDENESLLELEREREEEGGRGEGLRAVSFFFLLPFLLYVSYVFFLFFLPHASCPLCFRFRKRLYWRENFHFFAKFRFNIPKLIDLFVNINNFFFVYIVSSNPSISQAISSPHTCPLLLHF